MKRKQNVNKLKEDYLIRIKSRTEHEDLPDMVELTTRGSFVHKNGSFFITYRDTETTGYAGCTTTLKVAEDASRVAMLRYGPAATHFLIRGMLLFWLMINDTMISHRSALRIRSPVALSAAARRY